VKSNKVELLEVQNQKMSRGWGWEGRDWGVVDQREQSFRLTRGLGFEIYAQQGAIANYNALHISK
jgi:hypothetical protein